MEYLEIENKKFKKALLGYNKKRVDGFLENLSIDFEVLENKNKDLINENETLMNLNEVLNQDFEFLKSQNKELEHKLEEKDSRFNSKNAIKTESDLIIKEAKLEAEKIIQNSKMKSENIIFKAEREEEKIIEKINRLKEQRKLFFIKYKSILTGHIDMLDLEDYN